jgi:type IV pilus assembly protein PilB
MKIVANLNVIERRVPQDGRARVRIPGGTVDARISTLPCLHGEKLVVRLLPSAARLPDLLGLGVSDEEKKLMLDVLASPQGLVLITGPTGSGKTNTLYAALNDGVDRTRNIITLEDPVEIELPGATQVQLDERAGLDFARGLRACLRQDPDVILVGEIRDHETADLAVRAALTGHLVMSTLHTLDAAAAMTRLTDMGVPPYLITSSLTLVVSQRLVRVPCDACSVPDVEAHVVLAELGVTDLHGDWTRAVGCPVCVDTGYLGRTAVLEMLPVSASIRTALLSGAGEDEVRRAARADGFASLLTAGVEAAREGRTTLAEVLRAVPRELLSGAVS